MGVRRQEKRQKKGFRKKNYWSSVLGIEKPDLNVVSEFENIVSGRVSPLNISVSVSELYD